MAASMRRCFWPSATASAKIAQFTRQSRRIISRYAYSIDDVVVKPLTGTKEAIYPPIVPPLWAKTKETEDYKRQLDIDKLNEYPTATEMINELRTKQCWHYIMQPACFHYSFLQLYQHSTKTSMVVGRLPDRIQDLALSEGVVAMAMKLKPYIIDCILQDQVHMYRHRLDLAKRDSIVGRQLTQNIIRVILTGLMADFQHLKDGQIDEDVEVQSFWKRDETRFQFLGKPLFLVRSREPLPEFVSKDSELCIGEVPVWNFAPENVSVFKRHINPTCFPGYKLGNPFNHGHTQVYMPHIMKQRCRENDTLDEVMQGIGLSTAFGWANALAMYNMFNPHRDLTQPLSIQNIVSDGVNFSLICYQLNTIALCSRSPGNPLRNICWYMPDAPLYATIQDGDVHGFNDELLQLIVAFFSNQTVPAKV